MRTKRLRIQPVTTHADPSEWGDQTAYEAENDVPTMVQPQPQSDVEAFVIDDDARRDDDEAHRARLAMIVELGPVWAITVNALVNTGMPLAAAIDATDAVVWKHLPALD